jgi:ABC-type lipoprotein release transport system permease subunit
MASRLAAARVLLAIAFRNLFASRAKSLIVGGIVLAGAVVVVVGSAMVDSIDSGMGKSVQGSLGGQLQVYSARSKEDLSLYGKPGGDQSQLEPIEDFAALKRVIAAVPNVRAVVPMAMDVATLTAGNGLDAALETLRADVRERARGASDAALASRYEAHKAHVRRLVALLQDDLKGSSPVLDAPDGEERERQRADRARAASDAFWADFDADAAGNLEFLENRIAPQSLSNPFMLLRYVGTDLDAYPRAFDRMRIVEGTSVPKGERGMLIGKLFAEDWLKLRAARLLDQVHEARASRGRRIAGDEELMRWLKEARGRTREILEQLDPVKAEQATARLRRALGSSRADLKALLDELFTSDDASFDRHYAVFYEQLAPLLRLYSVGVGDRIVLNAVSKSGYVNAASLEVYGFFEFQGLEKSSVAGWLGIMDLRSWRELYGYLTPDQAAEIQALKAGVKTREISREHADDELFGAGEASTSERAQPERIEVALGGSTRRARASSGPAGAEPDIDHGVALNAAVVLHDPARVKATMRDVQAALAAAHLDMKVVGWQEAAGPLGQFVSLARIVLYTAVFLIFAVALVIINNATVMATLRRVKEIGTLRAIGAQKRFVVAMLLLETGAVGLAFGAAGTLLGAGLVVLVRWLGGIPATNDDMYFFFSGPSLVPRVGGAGLAVALAVAFVVSVLSGLYPALVATRVTPLEAMQSDD